MGMEWTIEQKKVIDNREKNILVSAAAGSGKTAVLVERIIQMVTDKEHPVDVDKLLIVTFTNAAAAEMRERILKALIKAHRQDPKNEHLQKQMTYINNAMIMTIDAFCLNVVRENFSKLDIDPGFRIGDNDELEMLKADVLEEILEKHYEEGSEDFLTCMEEYVSKKGVSSIESVILRLYQEAESYPDPIGFINYLRKNYEELDEKLVVKTSWFKVVLEDMRDKLLEVHSTLKEALDVCYEEGGPLAYIPAIDSDIKFINQVLEKSEFDEYQELFSSYAAPRLGTIKKTDNVDEDKKEWVKNSRDEFKDILKKYKEKYFANGLNANISIINMCSDSINIILDLVIEFLQEFSVKKRENNIVDFSDIEHMAYDILYDKDENDRKPSEIAIQLSENFYEILIDEYQDSNYVQEYLLTAVSKQYKGENNIFMVGDVKQSIYGFRQARPELFLEKLNTYETESDTHMKICLSKNFRSRREILDFTNLVFGQIMGEDIGGIVYDAESALYYGADYPEGNDNDTEVILIDTKEDEDSLDLDDEESATKYEMEATVIADRIEKLMRDSFMVKDKASGKMRKVQYGDIVILLRSLSDIGDTITRILGDRDIPVDCVTTTGYFDSFEVKSILNYLSVIDNPRQDIPLVSVLRNVYEFTESELAYIKGDKNGLYWEALKCYEGELSLRVERVLSDIEEFRRISTYTPLYELIDRIMKRTGFREFVLSMGKGVSRISNIDMLMEKAIKYEETSYKGLFNFVRYIGRIRKYELDAGISNQENTTNSVKIMTIHKSKGLEYPVVICAGMGKNFNEKALNEKILINSKLGLGVDYVDTIKSIKYKTLIKEAIRIKNKKENYAEELRVLYVALTRAKEKLILVGSVKVDSAIEKAYKNKNHSDIFFGAVPVLGARNYMDWIILSLIRHKSMKNILHDRKEVSAYTSEIYENRAKIKVSVLGTSDVVYEAVKRVVVNDYKGEALVAFDSDNHYDETVSKLLEKNLTYRYDFIEDINLKAKVSVSDVKHARILEKEGNFFRDEENTTEEILDFGELTLDSLMTKEVSKGAIRGTAYHRVLELLDYSLDIETVDDVKNAIKLMVDSGKISADATGYVDAAVILEFIKSPVGRRMKEAFGNGQLYREKQFVMGIHPEVVFAEYKGDELLLVQGIIDAMFEEDNEYVIVDYKTDNVTEEKTLIDRYEVQLQLYASAVKNSTNKNVKELIIYSTKLRKEIKIELM